MIFGKKLDPSSAEYFEKKYKKKSDPWDFVRSDYEQSRYNAILSALDGKRYANAFEPGCSIGTLTEKLITICDRVEAIDFAASAIATARARCPQPEITFRVLSLPERLPLEGFDLIVLSEVGYYFAPEQWRAMVRSMVETAAPGTTILASHWLGHSPDHRLHGDEVHAAFPLVQNLHLLQQERLAGFRLERWERRE